VKCALGIDRNGRIGGTVRLHREWIPSSPKFVYIFCLLDRGKMELTKRAYRTSLPKGMIQFNFDYRVRMNKPEQLDGRWLELVA